MNNMDIWAQVEKTGFQNQSSLKRFARAATNVFGTCGIVWGVKLVSFSHDDLGFRYNVELWYELRGQRASITMPGTSFDDAVLECSYMLGFFSIGTDESNENYVNEEWRIYPPIPSYEASSFGRVRTVDSHKIKKTSWSDSGYESVSLTHDGRVHTKLVSRVICETFHGKPPSLKHQAAHNNGVSSDNRKDNLRWATVKENHADKVMHGTTLRGEKNPKSKVTQADVDVARIRRDGGDRVADIARDLGLYLGHTYKIVRGANWEKSIITEGGSWIS